MGLINEEYREELLSNPNVEDVRNSHIIYTIEFKELSIREFSNGESAPGIWLRHDFDTNKFPKGYFRKCIHRCRDQQKRDGKSFSRQENRGRPKGKRL